MNQVGGTVAWEATLRRLGLDVNKEEGRIRLKETLAKELEMVLDSTKRKRRKKMKKHKWVSSTSSLL